VSAEGARPHVVVIGGGFGGIAAVRALRDSAVDVTLVDRNAYNTFQPLLYQVATAALNPGDITYFLRALRARQSNVNVRQATVTAVDPQARTVGLDDGETLRYDYLIVATGVTANYFGVPGAAEHSLALYTRVEALAVRDRLLSRLELAARDPEQRGVSMVIVGGGATGVEMAGSLAELRNTALGVLYPELDPAQTHIVLVEMADQLLTPYLPRLRRYTARALTRRGVRLRLRTTVKEVRENGVVVDDGELIPADMVIWASGIKVPDAVAEWGLPQGERGRIAVDDDLRVHGFRDVFTLPQVAQPAMQAGKHAGRQVAALVAGEPVTAFHYWDKGMLATIGRSSAVAQIRHVPGFTGLPAWLIWLGIHIVYLLDNRNRFATLVNLGVRYVFWPRHLDAIVGEVPTPDAGA
jgi:NADH dehydrogenase